jgi:hypothetical protein
VQRVTFKNNQVSAFFTISSNVACPAGGDGIVIANGSLMGAESVSATTGMPTFMSNGVVVDLSYFNSCTGTAIAFGSGGAPNTLTPPNKKLESAAMVGTATVQDFGSGVTVPVSFNVTLVGVGNISQSKSGGHSKSKLVGSTGGPLQVTISSNQFSNSNRSASATGTMSIEGFAVNIDFTFASFNQNENTTKTISKF